MANIFFHSVGYHSSWLIVIFFFFSAQKLTNFYLLMDSLIFQVNGAPYKVLTLCVSSYFVVWSLLFPLAVPNLHWDPWLLHGVRVKDWVSLYIQLSKDHLLKKLSFFQHAFLAALSRWGGCSYRDLHLGPLLYSIDIHVHYCICCVMLFWLLWLCHYYFLTVLSLLPLTDGQKISISLFPYRVALVIMISVYFCSFSFLLFFSSGNIGEGSRNMARWWKKH